MYRAIPTSNKILEDKWTKKRMDMHRQRLKTIKPTFETFHRKAQISHLLRNSKKEQIFEGNFFIY